MDIQINKVVRTVEGKVTLVELEVAGIVMGFRQAGRIAYRYKEGKQVMDREGLYIPRLAYGRAIRMSYGIFSPGGECHEQRRSVHQADGNTTGDTLPRELSLAH